MYDSTLAAIREIVADVCDISADKVQPTVDLIDELGVDSVDFLDIAHEIDRRFNIKLPIEDWAKAVTGGEPAAKYFVVGRIVESIERLKAA